MVETRPANSAFREAIVRAERRAAASFRRGNLDEALRFIDADCTELWLSSQAMGCIAGYTIINVKSREEALEWTRRYPNPAVDGGVAEIEVRQFFELEDLPPSESIERFRDIVPARA